MVGLGGEANYSKSGAYVVVNEEDLSVVHEARDSASPISLTTFSPDGETLAVAAEDGSIYLYAVQDEYELIGRCIRHTKPVTHIDFSADGEWIRSNSLGQDICFFNADDASFQSNIASMKDVKWASCSCIYSWHVRGCHQTNYKGEAPTMVHIPHNDKASAVACGTSYGYVRLHSYPCASDEAEYHRYAAHVGAISGLRYSFDDQRLLTIGVNDRCILQWRCVPYAAEQDLAQYDGGESEDFALEVRAPADLKEDFMPLSSDTCASLLSGVPGAEVSLSTTSALPSLDTWLQSVVPPNIPPARNSNVPDMSLKLEHIYGYRCQDMRNHVRYTCTGEVVYPCAAIGVITNRTTGAQRFFQVSGSVKSI